MSQRETAISKELLEKVLASVSEDAVLVGGQALAIWVAHYGLDTPETLQKSISDGADFLGSRRDLDLIVARLKNVTTMLPPRKTISALVGQALIHVTDDTVVNVDVIHRVVGVKADAIRKNGFEAALGETRFLVMHPLDVLTSRIQNLWTLKSKCNTYKHA